jgi:hypothetical protein
MGIEIPGIIQKANNKYLRESNFYPGVVHFYPKLLLSEYFYAY